MDRTLIVWARAVKRKGAPPPLWFFTDARAADPLGIIAALPRDLSGVVLRPDADPASAALAPAIARLCRARRLALVVAGDARLAARLGAGLHLRGGRYPGWIRLAANRLRTASAHDAGEIVRARRAGASILFISPVFATRSHPNAAPLGPFRFRALARFAAPAKAYALGGMEGASVRRLGKSCAGIAAIDAFLCNEVLDSRGFEPRSR